MEMKACDFIVEHTGPKDIASFNYNGSMDSKQIKLN
jgi:hypothetical protein